MLIIYIGNKKINIQKKTLRVLKKAMLLIIRFAIIAFIVFFIIPRIIEQMNKHIDDALVHNRLIEEFGEGHDFYILHSQLVAGLTFAGLEHGERSRNYRVISHSGIFGEGFLFYVKDREVFMMPARWFTDDGEICLTSSILRGDFSYVSEDFVLRLKLWNMFLERRKLGHRWVEFDINKDGVMEILLVERDFTLNKSMTFNFNDKTIFESNFDLEKIIAIFSFDFENRETNLVYFRYS